MQRVDVGSLYLLSLKPFFAYKFSEQWKDHSCGGFAPPTLLEALK